VTGARLGARDDLDRLLDDFTRETPEVVAAVVVSVDGLPIARSAGVDDTLADQLSAAASGLLSLSRAATTLLAAGTLGQAILEMTGGYLFLTSIGRGATAAVHAGPHCDLGLVGHGIAVFGERVGDALDPGVRVGWTGSTAR
jgi:hypothetical protein